MGLLAMEVAAEALRHAGVLAGERLGLFAGVGGLRAHWNDMMGAFANQRDDGQEAWARGLKDLHPFWMLRHLSNNAHALLAAELGIQGEGVTFGGATAGAQALSAAILALADHAVDAALVVAYDSLLEPETLVELGARKAATTASLPALAAAYDQGAHGVVPGEAAVALVLTRPEEACPRALALVKAADGGDGQCGEPLPETIADVVGRIAERDPVVDGAARAWPALDLAERQSIAPSVSPDAALLATTSATGQLGSAAALAQVITLSEVLRRRTLPAIAGLRSPAAGPLRPMFETTATCAESAVGVSTGAPGLVAAVRVALPRGRSSCS